MHLGFLNPQGNFDADNSHITEHPDFGGQLIYVKQVAIAMAFCHPQVNTDISLEELSRIYFSSPVSRHS